MDSSDDPENAAKVSDSAYSNSCSNSNSQSRRSHSSKSTHSSSNSSGGSSSGYGGKPSTSGGSKDKDAKKKSKGSHVVETLIEVAAEETRPQELVQSGESDATEVADNDVPAPAPVLQPDQLTVIDMEVSTTDYSTDDKDDIVASMATPAVVQIHESQASFTCVISTKDALIMYSTAAVTDTLGFTKEKWVGRHFIDFIHPKDHATFKNLLSRELRPERIILKNGYDLAENTMCCRMRKFRDLNAGFHILDHPTSFVPFFLHVTLKDVTNDNGKSSYLLVRASMLISGYKTPAEVFTKPTPFNTRHLADGQMLFIDRAAIIYLGYLPQEMTLTNALQLYHPDDLGHLLRVYEGVIHKGLVLKTKVYRMRAQNGNYIKLETEFSRDIDPWTNKLEFVTGRNYVIEGPENPDVFQLPEESKLGRTFEEFNFVAISQRDKITRLLNDDADSVMPCDISPHHETDSKTSTETPPSYHNWVYNETLQRYFDRYEPCLTGDIISELNKNENDEDSSQKASTSNSDASAAEDDRQQLTENVLTKHDSVMKKDFAKHKRGPASRGSRATSMKETQQNTLEHLARCNAPYRPSEAEKAETELETPPAGTKRSSRQMSKETGSRRVSHHHSHGRHKVARRAMNSSPPAAQPSQSYVDTITTVNAGQRASASKSAHPNTHEYKLTHSHPRVLTYAHGHTHYQTPMRTHPHPYMYPNMQSAHGYPQPFAAATAHAMGQSYMQTQQNAQASAHTKTPATAHANGQAPQPSAPPATQYANAYAQYAYTSAQQFAQQYAQQYAQAAGKSFVPPTLASAQPFGPQMPLAVMPGMVPMYFMPMTAPGMPIAAPAMAMAATAMPMAASGGSAAPRATSDAPMSTSSVPMAASGVPMATSAVPMATYPNVVPAQHSVGSPVPYMLYGAYPPNMMGCPVMYPHMMPAMPTAPAVPSETVFTLSEINYEEAYKSTDSDGSTHTRKRVEKRSIYSIGSSGNTSSSCSLVTDPMRAGRSTRIGSRYSNRRGLSTSDDSREQTLDSIPDMPAEVIYRVPQIGKAFERARGQTELRDLGFNNDFTTTDEESDFSLGSSFYKTDSGSNEDSDYRPRESADQAWSRRALIYGQKPDYVIESEKKQTLKVPTWEDTASPELIFQFEMPSKTVEEVLAEDRLELKKMKQPSIVNDQLSQLYLELELNEQPCRLTLDHESGSEDDNTAEGGDDKITPKLDSSVLAMIYEEDCPYPPKDSMPPPKEPVASTSRESSSEEKELWTMEETYCSSIAK